MTESLTSSPARAATTSPPYLRLDSRLGWFLGPPETRPQVPYDDRPLQLAIVGRSPISLTEPFGSLGGRTLPRGVAISSEGRVFVADPAGRVVLSAGVQDAVATAPDDAPPGWPFRPLWSARPLPERPAESVTPTTGPPRPADPFTLVRPVDVAFSPSGDLVVVDEGAARVLVLAYPTARLRHLVDLAPGRPRSVCFDHRGRAYVADLGPAAAGDAAPSGTVHRFDRGWRRDDTFPRAALGQPDLVVAASGSRRGGCGGGCGGCGCDSGRGCEPLPGRAPVVWVLDGGAALALDDDGRLLPAAALEDPAQTGAGGSGVTPPPLVVDEAVPAPDGTLGPGLTWADPSTPGRAPLRLPRMPLTRDGRLAGTVLPLVARPRRVEVPRYGSVTTTALDGGRTGFAWDRLAMTATLPPTTRLLVSTLTSDVEIAADRLSAIPQDRWSTPLAIEPGDVPEVLVQSRPGRYLWVRIEMSGDGTVSPSISQIDVFGPRRSSMRHLPASFHEDAESAHFLDRYLSYFDTVLAEVTAVNRDIAALFDPRVVPEEFLSWLGAWFDLDFDTSWPTWLRREMVAEAVPYFRMRGTVAGLKRILQWHTGLRGELPQVIEHFRLSGVDEPFMIGGVALEPGDHAHSFTVVLPSYVVPDDRRSVLERLVEASIPAHTRYHLHLVEPGVTIAAQSTIGIDMTLTSADAGVLDGARLDHSFATGPQRPAALVHPPHPLRHTGQGGPSC
jgi:phage tail-like protein